MKKKIILILSMCALLVCLFVLSASATIVFCSPDGVSNDFKGISASQYAYDAENDFVIQELTVFDDAGNSYMSYLVSNPVSLKNYLNGFSNFDNFRSAHENYDTDLENIFYYFQEYAFNYFYNYTEITQEDLTVQYNQGKTDGVTEFKESEEYTNILSSKYEEGKTDGAEAFKSSDEYSQELQAEYTKGYGVGYEAYKDSAEYESALNTQFNLGSSTGVKNYLESVEYSNALQNEYDNGYEAATTEDNQKRAKNMLGTALGISGALIIVLLCVYFFVGRKARKRR